MAARYLSKSRLVNLSLSSSRSISTTITTAPRLSPPSFSLLRHRPISTAAAFTALRNIPPATSFRLYSTSDAPLSLSTSSDPKANSSIRPPAKDDDIGLEGCDFQHWLIILNDPEGDPTRDELIDSYVKMLADIVGSEEEARMKMYSVSTRCYYAFGCLIDEELTKQLKENPKVKWVVPDCYLDVKNKDYGGEPFINGQAVPYDPKYHEEWIRNNASQTKSRDAKPRDTNRPRNNRRGEKETPIDQ